MRRFIHLVFLIPLACSVPQSEENTDGEVARDRQELLAGSKLLWPMKDGKATVRVCFLPLDTGGLTFPLAKYAPDLAKVLPERKQWIRKGVEAEWNAKTVVQFVGWNDCTAGDDADIRIQLITSQGTAICGHTADAVTKGAYCVEEIGTKDKGKRVFLNATWGDEVLYTAHYAQTVDQNTYDPNKDIPPSWTPAICGTQVTNALQFRVSNAAIDAFARIYEPCMQNTVVHEFGHLAGFSHEQNRKDVSPDCAKRYAAATPDMPSDEDTPLGAFDQESIMSYCRAAIPPTLTAEDVAQTNAVYAKYAEKTTTTPAADAGGGGDGGKSHADDTDPTDDTDEPAPKKKPKGATTTSTGGCGAH
jgi:hypothetical protein